MARFIAASRDYWTVDIQFEDDTGFITLSTKMVLYDKDEHDQAGEQ